jgi:hypothetical protein
LVTLDEVQYWSETQIPRFREWAAENTAFSQHQKSFEFWTSSGFTSEADEYLQSRWANTRKFYVRWRPGMVISAFVEKYASPSVLKTLQQFYTQDLM